MTNHWKHLIQHSESNYVIPLHSDFAAICKSFDNQVLAALVLQQLVYRTEIIATQNSKFDSDQDTWIAMPCERFATMFGGTYSRRFISQALLFLADAGFIHRKSSRGKTTLYQVALETVNSRIQELQISQKISQSLPKSESESCYQINNPDFSPTPPLKDLNTKDLKIKDQLDSTSTNVTVLSSSSDAAGQGKEPPELLAVNIEPNVLPQSIESEENLPLPPSSAVPPSQPKPDKTPQALIEAVHDTVFADAPKSSWGRAGEVAKKVWRLWRDDYIERMDDLLDAVKAFPFWWALKFPGVTLPAGSDSYPLHFEQYLRARTNTQRQTFVDPLEIRS